MCAAINILSLNLILPACFISLSHKDVNVKILLLELPVDLEGLGYRLYSNKEGVSATDSGPCKTLRVSAADSSPCMTWKESLLQTLVHARLGEVGCRLESMQDLEGVLAADSSPCRTLRESRLQTRVRARPILHPPASWDKYRCFYFAQVPARQRDWNNWKHHEKERLGLIVYTPLPY